MGLLHGAMLTYLVQCTVPVQSSITVSWLEVHCAVLSDWSEHSWQRAVCHPTGPLAQAGRQMEALQVNEKRKTLKLILHQRKGIHAHPGMHKITPDNQPLVHF
ncbi:hypothetical protein XENORESO_018905 [Xenotaenia resolanae]|uniref:Secreted protein n=1 Tax=Xenotaenia resolanae TaxID=208358 RepID=A0ABV0X0B4_9TELE